MKHQYKKGDIVNLIPEALRLLTLSTNPQCENLKINLIIF